MATIPRGCTARNKFTFPYAQEEVVELYITYMQAGKKVIEKTKTDCTWEEDEESGAYKIATDLSQEDTLAFTSGAVQMQIRVLLENGSAVKCKIINATADEVLKKGVI